MKRERWAKEDLERLIEKNMKEKKYQSRRNAYF